MTTALNAVFSYAGLLVGMAVAVVWLMWRPGSRAARRAIVAVICGYALAGMYAIPYAASRILVGGFTPLSATDLPPAPAAIVVLGSGARLVQHWDGAIWAYPEGQGADRVWETVRVHGLTPGTLVISSGGAVNPRPNAPTSGGTMRDVLVRLGVPAERIVVEGTSRTTREEAELIAPMLSDLKIDRVVVVTSDFHMRRAMATFMAVGLQVTPAIVRDPFELRPLADWLRPSNEGLAFTGTVVREFVAVAWYWSRGWLAFSAKLPAAGPSGSGFRPS